MNLKQVAVGTALFAAVGFAYAGGDHRARTSDFSDYGSYDQLSRADQVEMGIDQTQPRYTGEMYASRSERHHFFKRHDPDRSARVTTHEERIEAQESGD